MSTGYMHNTYEMQRVKMQADVEQWRTHLEMDRVMLSRSLPEMVAYCRHHGQHDPLIHPPKDNPYKEKMSCTIL
jgi:hypothetical protein